jgi:hypothetical protein
MAKKKKRSKKYDPAKLEKMLDECIQKSEKAQLEEKGMSKIKAVMKSTFEAIVKTTSGIASKFKEKVDDNPSKVLHAKMGVGGFMVGHGAFAVILSAGLTSTLLGVACIWFGLSILENACEGFIQLD